MTFEAYEFDSAHEAIQHMEAQGGAAIRWEGQVSVFTGRAVSYHERVEFPLVD